MILIRMIEEQASILRNHRIYHRDIKPENIIVTKEGRLKFLDFGLSLQLLEGKSETGIYNICGTLKYMHPELVKAYARNEKTASCNLWVCELHSIKKIRKILNLDENDTHLTEFEIFYPKLKSHFSNFMGFQVNDTISEKLPKLFVEDLKFPNSERFKFIRDHLRKKFKTVVDKNIVEEIRTILKEINEKVKFREFEKLPEIFLKFKKYANDLKPFLKLTEEDRKIIKQGKEIALQDHGESTNTIEYRNKILTLSNDIKRMLFLFGMEIENSDELLNFILSTYDIVL